MPNDQKGVEPNLFKDIRTIVILAMMIVVAMLVFFMVLTVSPPQHVPTPTAVERTVPDAE